MSAIDLSHVQDYKTDSVFVDYNSDLTPNEADSLIGKSIIKVDAREYSITLYFSDGTELTTTGGRWDACCLGVSLDKSETT